MRNSKEKKTCYSAVNKKMNTKNQILITSKITPSALDKSGGKRIFGFDFARGLAIIGMIFVNFTVVMSTPAESGWLSAIIEAISGKAAALFVVLAGIGMTLMNDSIKCRNDVLQTGKVKIILLKRAAFLFVIGLSYYFIWDADILHFYGVFLSIGILFLAVPRKWLIALSLIIVCAYSLLFPAFNYDKNWDWSTMTYAGFFTFPGFFKNLFINGFHPVFPWIAFLLTGIWIGRINLKDKKTRKKVLFVSLVIFIIFKGISMFYIHILVKYFPSAAAEISGIFGTAPMPPLFFYMLTAVSFAVFIISLSVYITETFGDTLLVRQMVNTGQLALSNYFFHVVVGMLFVKLVFGKVEQVFSFDFTIAYACFYCALAVFLSHFWRNKFSRGPLEYIMRKITG